MSFNPNKDSLFYYLKTVSNEIDKYSFSLSIDEAYLRPENLELVYTINYDSLRMFSQADNFISGIERGRIAQHNKDSMVIYWGENE
jgi:hypothetical protein